MEQAIWYPSNLEEYEEFVLIVRRFTLNIILSITEHLDGIACIDIWNK
jgi:hypothetical protein